MTKFGLLSVPSLAIILAILLPLIDVAAASECGGETNPKSYSLYFDNDYFLPDDRNKDRNYTMGIAIEFSGDQVRCSALTTPLHWLNEKVGFYSNTGRNDSKTRSASAIRLGISAFTPGKIEDPNPIHIDRPYASLLYATVREHVLHKETRLSFSELTVGILGLGIAEDFQTWLHRRMRGERDIEPVDPLGWRHQISDGGEPTFRYRAGVKHGLKQSEFFDLRLTGELNVGYYTNAVVGAGFRIGRLRTPWWEWDSMPMQDSSVTSGRPPGFELYGWASSQAAFWGYNVLLQGQFRNSRVTINSGDIERVVLTNRIGATIGYIFAQNRIGLSYAFSRRSAEFDLPAARHHEWGGFYLTFERNL